MACPVNYNPNPPRAWYRVENACPYGSIGLDNYYEIEMSRKGNVLQYKKNSSDITQNQRYSQIAKGMWSSRKKAWASQTDTVSMPNVNSLKRVNYITVDSNGNPATGTITCPSAQVPPIPSALFPNPGPGQLPVQTIPPPPDDQSSNISIPYEAIFPQVPPTILPDGGNLLCTVVQNICTGEIIATTGTTFCNPTSDSDVPGPIIKLCYNPALHQTYYPRQRLVMPVSGDKFPVGYKFLQPA
jgi:hypothetical protein